MSCVPRRHHDDGGAIAIIAVLAVVLLLIPVAAMAADLGAVYVTDGDLQQAADVAVRAGADQLALDQHNGMTPAEAIPKARDAAVTALCAGASAPHSMATACADTGWAADGDPANGEVSFYAGTPDAEKGFVASQAATQGQTNSITGIRVVTPRLRVEFGFAAVFSADHTTLQKAATASLFTVLPRGGALPFTTTVTAIPLAGGPLPHYCALRSATLTTFCGGGETSFTYVTDPAHSLRWDIANGLATLPRPSDPLPSTSPLSTQATALRDGMLATSSTPGLAGRLMTRQCKAPGQNAVPTLKIAGSAGVEAANYQDFLRNDGRLDPSILRCGRLAVLTVVSASGVRGYRLLWLDSQLAGSDRTTDVCLTRGLLLTRSWWTCGTPVRGYTGYILDPRLLPATVADTDATNTLDTFVGSGLPATVRLLRDAADPPPR